MKRPERLRNGGRGGASRRDLLLGIGTAAFARSAQPSRAQSPARVIVIGGGFAGAACARALKRGGVAVTLIEPNPVYTACPLSNSVIAGSRDISAQRFGYGAIAAEGVTVVPQAAASVDASARTVTLGDGARLPYDRLVLAPGVDLRFDALPGYDAGAAETMPHAWKAGAQTLLLRARLEAMQDGGVFVMCVPANPYRCPPGPYERASLIAHYLKTRKPRSKIIILDAKDVFSKQRLFQAAWAKLYPGMIEWVGQSAGGTVRSVDAAEMTLATDFATRHADAANVIPAQQAGAIARMAGAADRSGWCPVNPLTFESALVPGIHVIGDAAILGAIPKSAFAAAGEARVCAAALLEIFAGREPRALKLINTCYSFIAPDAAISVAGVYRPANSIFADVEGAGGTSALDAPDDVRAQEAVYAEAWFRTVTEEVFG